MNCDLILNENSCRFCLGDAEDGTELFSDRKNYFCVQKRLVDCSEIFKYLEMKIHNENQASNIPNRICNRCKTTTCEFYILKKNFQQNEAVFFGNFNDDRFTNYYEVQKMFEEFISEHKYEVEATKYSDKLEIFKRCSDIKQDVNRISNPAVISSQKREMYECQKCSSIFDERDHYENHDKHCTVSKQIQLDDLICSVSNQSDDCYCLNDSDVMESAEFDQNEEYLEEDGEVETGSINEEIFENDVKHENKSFMCTYCDRTFISRSGRDTHQQLKHKIPEEFYENYPDMDTHEFEIELHSGQLMKCYKCPTCDLVSKRKNHHITHLVRHAIRKKDEMTKQQEQKSNLVISKSESLQKDQSTEINLVYVEQITGVQQSNVRKVPKFINEETDNSCADCGSKFKDEVETKLHFEKFSNTGLCSQVCSECNVAFLSENRFRRHQSHHLLGFIADILSFFECSTCSVIFGNQKDLDKHNTHHKDASYVYEPEKNSKLEGCEQIFDALKPEVEWNRIDLQCAYCTRFGSKTEMNLHMALFHGSLVCPIDRQEFGRGTNYFVDHMKIKHPELFGESSLTFTCPHCKTTDFQQKELMVKHSRICQAKSFICHHCPKRFALERQLKLHLASVNGIKNHKCSDCDKSFTSITELNVHNRSHTKDKPYCCTFPSCNKRFRTNSHRSSHMYTHAPDKKFQCKTCSAMFQTPGAKRIHEKSHTSKIVCQICLKEFSQRSHYVRHVNDQHRIRCNSSNLEESIRNFNQ